MFMFICTSMFIYIYMYTNIDVHIYIYTPTHKHILEYILYTTVVILT